MSARSESKNTLVTSLNTDVITPTTEAGGDPNILTAAEVLTGLYMRDCNAAIRTDVLPSAADLAAAIPGVAVGTALRWHVENTTGTAHELTISAGSGGGTSGTMTIAQHYSKEFLIVFTAVVTPAYTIYSLGTTLH